MDRNVQQSGNNNYGTISATPTPSGVDKPSATEIRTYWWRWWVLSVYMLNLILNNLLWITFAPIADVMRCYYGITDDVVNTLSLVSAILALLLVLPASWLLTRFGIRFVLVISSAANALGGAIRVGGAGSGYFSLLMVGQIVSSFNGLMSGAPTLFSEIWFPATERATATALGASVAPQVSLSWGWGVCGIPGGWEICGTFTKKTIRAAVNIILKGMLIDQRV